MAEFSTVLKKLETYPEWNDLRATTNKITRNGLSSDTFLFKEARQILRTGIRGKDYLNCTGDQQAIAIAVVMWYYLMCFYILKCLIEYSEGRGVYLKILKKKFKIGPFSSTNMLRVDSIMNNNSAFNFHETKFAVKLNPYGEHGVIFLCIFPIDHNESILDYAVNYAVKYDTLENVDLQGISGSVLICPDARDITKAKGYGYSSNMNPVAWNFNSLYDFKISELEKHFK